MIAQRYPLLRIFGFFCLGLLAGRYVPLNFELTYVLIGTLILSFVLGQLKNVFGQYSNRWIFGLSLSGSFLLLGYCCFTIYAGPPPDKLSLPAAQSTYILKCISNPKPTASGFSINARVLSPEITDYSPLKVVIYVRSESQEICAAYGDIVRAEGKLQPLEKPLNPHQFDYRNYMWLKQIRASLFVDEDNLFPIEKSRMLRSFSFRIQQYMLDKIDQWQLQSSSASVLKALLLGYKLDIEKDLLKSYSTAGAMHVLAVSGLHVGILWLFASYLLSFLHFLPKGKTLKNLLLIMVLWSYALITGMSASVVRASAMFTFVSAGKALNRNTSVYNTLLVSAFVLLLIRPSYLFEVGFQLSYAAVFGIVFLYPILSSLWKPRWRILKFIRDLTTVSIAAQIGTFPLGLFYFHQFPILFLLSNFIVLPIVSILMYLGISYLILSMCGLRLSFIQHILNKLVSIMNKGVAWVESHSAWQPDEVFITSLQLILIYGLIILLLSWLFLGNIRRLRMALMVAIGLSLTSLFNRWEAAKPSFTAYSIYRHTAISVYQGGRLQFLGDENLLNDNARMQYEVYPHWNSLFPKDSPELICLDSIEQCFFPEFGICIINEMLPSLDTNLQTWLINTEELPPKEMSNTPERIVLSSKIGSFAKHRWLRWAETFNIEVRDLLEEGAVQISPPDIH